MTDNANFSLRLVPPSERTVFTLQFTTRVDDTSGDLLNLVVTTDAPLDKMEPADAVADVIEFTEAMIASLKEVRDSLLAGTSTPVPDPGIFPHH